MSIRVKCRKSRSGWHRGGGLDVCFDRRNSSGPRVKSRAWCHDRSGSSSNGRSLRGLGSSDRTVCGVRSNNRRGCCGAGGAVGRTVGRAVVRGGTHVWALDIGQQVVGTGAVGFVSDGVVFAWSDTLGTSGVLELDGLQVGGGSSSGGVDGLDHEVDGGSSVVWVVALGDGIRVGSSLGQRPDDRAVDAPGDLGLCDLDGVAVVSAGHVNLGVVRLFAFQESGLDDGIVTAGNQKPDHGVRTGDLERGERAFASNLKHSSVSTVDTVELGSHDCAGPGSNVTCEGLGIRFVGVLASASELEQAGQRIRTGTLMEVKENCVGGAWTVNISGQNQVDNGHCQKCESEIHDKTIKECC